MLYITEYITETTATASSSATAISCLCLRSCYTVLYMYSSIVVQLALDIGNVYMLAESSHAYCNWNLMMLF
jgi:hypothetical protein